MTAGDNCDGKKLLNWFQYDQILIEMHAEFWYWEGL